MGLNQAIATFLLTAAGVVLCLLGFVLIADNKAGLALVCLAGAVIAIIIVANMVPT